MVSQSRNVGALALSIMLPLLSYVTTDRTTIAIPESLTPNLVPPPITRLQHYLRIRTDHPAPAYAEAAVFLNHTAAALLPDAVFTVHPLLPGKPIVIVTLRGVDPSLPALMLNSHTDVVPAEPEHWLYPPFAARLIYAQSQWRLYARGAQDMKSVGMQYLEALSALTATGWRPHRTIHITAVPDEEIGGGNGMGVFVKSPLFHGLNVGVALDEGLPHPEARFNVYYGERQTWWLAISVSGSPGHGATFPETSAGQILHHIVGRALNFRRQQFEKFNSTNALLGDALGVNLVYLKTGNSAGGSTSGPVMNMIPTTVEAGFDIRVPPLADPNIMEKTIESWMECPDGKRCPGASHRFIMQVKNPTVTARDPVENPYYGLFAQGLDSAGISDRLVHGIFPAATDGRYVRELGIPCFGFSPIENTPDLLHKHNEFITLDGYLKGIKIYEQIIRHLSEPLPPKQQQPSHSAVNTPGDGATIQDSGKEEL